MKPRFGSGSRDIYYITNDDELKKAYETAVSSDEDFVLEEVFKGTEYGVDLVIINGECYLILAREKVITPLPQRQEVAYFAVSRKYDNELLNNIKYVLEKTAKVLGYDNCFVNADVIVSYDQKNVSVIEISPRPAGYNLHNICIPVSSGVDYISEYIKFLIGEKFNFEPKEIKQTEIRYFDFEDKVISKVPTFEQLKNNSDLNILYWNCNIKKGDYMNKVTDGHSVMNRGFFIVEGKDRDDLIRQSEFIFSQFE